MVGAGWSLQAGGIVSRTVQGKADEQTGGFLYQNQNFIFSQETSHCPPFQPLTCVELDGVSPISQMASGQLDGEPDIFSFSVGGYNGKFYFDMNDEPVLIPKQDIKIDYVLSTSPGVSALRSFKITVPNGDIYHFGIDPDDLSRYVDNVGVRAISNVDASEYTYRHESTWYLTKIESHDNAFSIDFSYRPEGYLYRNYTRNGSFTLSQNGNTKWINITEISGYQIEEIVTGSATAKFIPGADREDLGPTVNGNFPNAKRLDKIVIDVDNDDYCKEFVLNHSYLEDVSQYAFGVEDDKRIRLDSIQEQSCSILNSPQLFVPPYKFDYYHDQNDVDYFPSRLTKAIDHWGYYNGAQENEEEIGNLPFTRIEYTESGIDFDPSQGGSDRETSEGHMMLGNVEKITYPTGGYTTFEFEANDYFQWSVADLSPS